MTLLVPLAAVYFGFQLGSQADDVATLFGLGPAGVRVLAVGAWALAIGAAAAIWWFTVWALVRDVTLMHVTVAGSVGADVDDLADAAAAVTGIVPGQLTVTVHGQWRLVRAGLEPVPHADQRTLDRSRRNADAVGPGEEAVVICHGATMIGRLADYDRVGVRNRVPT